MVDEAKETYIKNHLDLDTVNENRTDTAAEETRTETTAADSAVEGVEAKHAPSAPANGVHDEQHQS